jgi:L-asparagine oxygenase
MLPTRAREALAAFRVDSGADAALHLRDLPLGDIPTTPPTPTSRRGEGLDSEVLIREAAGLLGHAVGYRPEHGGRLVQNIVPTRQGASDQVSTSSAVDLMFHTETAFHPHRPHYLLLLTLRGDPAAGTRLASVGELIDALDPDTVDLLFEPRFRTAVDASFLDGHPGRVGAPRPVLRGERDDPVLVFDVDLTTGIDPEAQGAVEQLTAAIRARHRTLVLEHGDLLAIDNHRAVHGRTSFAPRFDGSDRWLQRAFVVDDLGPSEAQRDGLVITTDFSLG